MRVDELPEGIENLHVLDKIKGERRDSIRKNRKSDSVHHGVGKRKPTEGLSKTHKDIISKKIKVL